MKRLNLNILLLTLILLANSCDDGEDGIDGFNSIISTEIEHAGLNCEAGGIRLNYGLDLNRNGNLDESEIETSDYICNGQEGSLELDNLVRLELGSSNVQTCEIEWYISEFETFHYPDFDKTDYANVNSILFVPSIVSYDISNTVTVELYNMTDNSPIANSQVEHNETYAFKYSENIFDDLPDYPITLGIRMKNSEVNGCGGLGIRSYLYILRE
jgi:hypothetical protein